MSFVSRLTASRWIPAPHSAVIARFALSPEENFFLPTLGLSGYGS
jgi:hypothetical protein